MAFIGQSNLSIKGEYSRTLLMVTLTKDHQGINSLANTKRGKKKVEKCHGKSKETLSNMKDNSIKIVNLMDKEQLNSRKGLILENLSTVKNMEMEYLNSKMGFCMKEVILMVRKTEMGN